MNIKKNIRDFTQNIGLVFILSVCFLITFEKLCAQENDTLNLNPLSIDVDTNITELSSEINTTDSLNNISDTLEPNISIIPKEPLYKDTITITFLKYKSFLSSEFLLFNLVTIKNYYEEDISGTFELFLPEKWTLISNANQQITIPSGDSIIIPIRLSVPKDIKGGVAYPIMCKLSTNKKTKQLSSFYVLKQEVSDFEFSVDKSTLLLNGVTGTGEFNIRIKNKGNVPELIRLEYQLGKLINIMGMESDSDYVYIALEPGQDTIINTKVWFKKPKPSEKYLMSRMDVSRINIKAYAKDKIKTSSVWCRYIPHKYINEDYTFNSPLNIAFFMNNLLSNSNASFRADIFGGLRLNENSTFSYFISAFNLHQNSNAFKDANIFLNRNLIFTLNYQYKGLNLTLGDRISPRNIPLMGRGIGINYNFGKTNINASFVRNNINFNYGGGFQLKSKIGRLPRFTLYGGIVRSDNSDRTLRKIGFNSSIPLKIINLGFGVNYNNVEYGDQSNFGNLIINSIGYNFSTGLNRKKFGFNAMYSYQPNIFFSSSESRNYTLTSFYKINNKSRIQLNFRGADILFGDAGNFNNNYSGTKLYNANLYYSTRIKSKTSILIGPEYQYNYRLNNLRNFEIERTYFGNAYRFATIATYSINNLKSISLFIKPGLSYVGIDNYYYVPDTMQSIRSKGLFNYNLGSTYNSGNIFRLNINYFYGPYFFFNQIDAINNYGVNKSLRISPIFQKTYEYDQYSIRLASMNSIILTMPGNSEKYSLAFTADLMTKNGWIFNLFANAYISSIDDKTNNRQSFRTYSMNFAVRKSFQVQQKNEKLFDFKAISFKDLNGNGTREENEPLLSNILFNISKDLSKQSDYNNSSFVQQELLSNYDGIIEYINMSNGFYRLSITPLINLGDLFPLNGTEQYFELNNHLTLYIPFVESYKVRGRIILIRDEFSSLGSIDPGNVKITATSTDGKKFMALSDKQGNFMVSIPAAGTYLVEVNDIFGDKFEVENTEVLVDFDGFKAFEVDFVFKEKKRKINFGGQESMISYGKDNENESKNPTTNNPENQTNASKSKLTDLSNEELQWLQELIYLTVKRTNNNIVNSGLTAADIELINKMIRDIHFADWDGKKGSTQLPPAVKREVDELIYTNVVNDYEQRVKDLNKQIANEDKKLQSTTNDAQKQKILSELDRLKQLQLIETDKYNSALNKLQELRKDLNANPVPVNSNQNEPKPAEFKSNDSQGYNNSNNKIPVDSKLPAGIVYSIQLGAYSHEVDPKVFKGLNPIRAEKLTDTKHNYHTGVFYTYKQAEAAKKEVVNAGLKDAFIVAYQDGKKISVAQAIRLEK
jgi:hypothetical protein